MASSTEKLNNFLLRTIIITKGHLRKKNNLSFVFMISFTYDIWRAAWLNNCPFNFRITNFYYDLNVLKFRHILMVFYRKSSLEICFSFFYLEIFKSFWMALIYHQSIFVDYFYYLSVKYTYIIYSDFFIPLLPLISSWSYNSPFYPLLGISSQVHDFQLCFVRH